MSRIPLTYRAWRDRSRPPDHEISADAFKRRLEEDERRAKDAFDVHISALWLAAGVTAGLCLPHEFAVGLLAGAMFSFLFHGWKALTS